MFGTSGRGFRLDSCSVADEPSVATHAFLRDSRHYVRRHDAARQQHVPCHPTRLAGIITLGYGFWRTAETLSDMSEPLNLICELANGAGLSGPLPLNIHTDKA